VATGRGGWDVPDTSWQWHFEQSKDGRGMLVFDHGWHQIAVAYWLFGPIRRVFAWVGPTMRQPADPAHRDPTLTATAAPRVIAPVGRIDSLSLVVWSAVPTADRYRVRLFDPQGTVLWQRETSDTTAIVPPTVSLRRGTSYYWKVESHTGFDRWAASDLVEFVP